jgi:galactokinase
MLEFFHDLLPAVSIHPPPAGSTERKMKAADLLASLRDGAADKILAALYGARAVPFRKKRLAGLIRRLSGRFPGAEAAVFRAPGRTELGGNHTDHNRGRVLAAAVDLDIVAAAVKTDDGRVVLSSPGYPRPIAVDLADARPRRAERGTTAALVRGVARFLGLGGESRTGGGFHAELDAALPQGAGLSSSAAIELLVATAFNELHLGGETPAVELAKAGQRAENEYYGKPCGLMDQIASGFGGVVAVDFKNSAAPVIEPIALDPEGAGYALFVLDTGGNHAGLTAAYAAVPAEMMAVAAFFGKDALRDVSSARFRRALPALRAKTGDRAVLRAMHFFAENERVAKQASLLGRKDFEGFLALARDSADSSWELLQNCLLPGDPRAQGVALGLALSRSFLEKRAGGRGAARVHGGGFAGTIQCWVPLPAARAYRAALESVFGERSVIPLRLCPRGAMRVL